MKKVICIMLSLLLLTGCASEPKPQQTAALETQPQTTTAPQPETTPETTPETNPETTPEQLRVPQGWYLSLLDQVKELQEYSFFDLDGDGVQELIMKTGAGEADTRYLFYGYHDAPYYLGEAWHSSSTLVSEGDGLIIYGGKQGYEWAFRIIKEGTAIREEMLFDRELTGEYRQFPIQVEAYVPNQPQLPEQTSPPQRKGLWAQYAKESSYGSDISFTAAEPEEYIVKIAVFTDTAVTRFRVFRLGSNMAGESTLAQTVFTLEELTPEKPVILGLTFGEIFPLYGIGYTDGSGETCYYAFASSMMDGSLEFFRFYPGNPDIQVQLPEQTQPPTSPPEQTQSPTSPPEQTDPPASVPEKTDPPLSTNTTQNTCNSCGQEFYDEFDIEFLTRHGYCWSCFWVYDGAKHGMCMQCGTPMIQEETQKFDGSRCESCCRCDQCGKKLEEWEFLANESYLCGQCKCS